MHLQKKPVMLLQQNLFQLKLILKILTNFSIENMCEKSNMYYFQTQGKDLKMTQEIKTLLGINLEMGSFLFPNMRLYWNK